jgi:hypothetical protein
MKHVPIVAEQRAGQGCVHRRQYMSIIVRAGTIGRYYLCGQFKWTDHRQQQSILECVLLVGGHDRVGATATGFGRVWLNLAIK